MKALYLQLDSLEQAGNRMFNPNHLEGRRRAFVVGLAMARICYEERLYTRAGFKYMQAYPLSDYLAPAARLVHTRRYAETLGAAALASEDPAFWARRALDIFSEAKADAITVGDPSAVRRVAAAETAFIEALAAQQIQPEAPPSPEPAPIGYILIGLLAGVAVAAGVSQRVRAARDTLDDLDPRRLHQITVDGEEAWWYEFRRRKHSLRKHGEVPDC